MLFRNLCIFAVLAMASPVWAQRTPTDDGCWSARAALRAGNLEAVRQSLPSMKPSNGAFERAHLAWTMAQSAEAFRTVDPAFSRWCVSNAEQQLAPLKDWLAQYGQWTDSHGKREPAWLSAQPEAASLAILAWIALDKVESLPQRRDWVAKFAEGLVALRHPQPQQYPFCAHVSFAPGRPGITSYAPVLERTTVASAPIGENVTDTGSPPATMGWREVGKAPGATWIPEMSRQPEALAAASVYLADKNMLEEAQQETLGIWAHLVTSDRLPAAFVPLPEGQGSLRAASVALDQFTALENATRSPVYSALRGLAGLWAQRLSPRDEADKAAQRLMGADSVWRDARDLAAPASYQIMHAEEGRAVQKAFDAIDITYPNGTPGKMVRVGRDNMFWMRFDVASEDDYHFYLVFLKSPLDGGLVSVMMRIDGDKIFQVPLGGASDPYVDMDFVDGPRALRQGPHSFGIRFSGLLMTQPALLDSVVAWPVVERRFLQLANGRKVMILHNRSDKDARTLMKDIPRFPADQMDVVDGHGAAASLTRLSDKRRRKEYIVVPAGGTAILQWGAGE